MRTVCQICFATVQDTDTDQHSAWHVRLVAALARMDRKIEQALDGATQAVMGDA